MSSITMHSGRELLRDVRQRIEARGERRQRERISRLLAVPESPRPYSSDAMLERLQAECAPVGQYGYDAHTSWWRGVQRAHWLLPEVELERPGARVLEIACGDGMAGRALAEYGHDVTLSDIEDWRDDRSRTLPFVAGDVSGELAVEAGSFDVVISYNAYIHFLDPRGALEQMLRACRPGGRVYLDFGHLFPSAFGLHAYRAVPIPYAQYLFEEEFLRARLAQRGLAAWPARLGQPTDGVLPLNGWRRSQYEELWASSGCTVKKLAYRLDPAHLGLVEQHSACFAGRGLEYEDLTTTSTTVVLEKPPGAGAAG